MLPDVDLDLFMRLAEKRASESPHDMLTYCAACLDTFVAVGKPAVHILDLIFNPEWQNNMNELPQMGEAKREKQAELKRLLIEKKN
jgi:glutamate synthase (NADPH/NADH) small chain